MYFNLETESAIYKDSIDISNIFQKTAQWLASIWLCVALGEASNPAVYLRWRKLGATGWGRVHGGPWADGYGQNAQTPGTPQRQTTGHGARIN